MTIQEWVAIIIAILGSGGLATIITAVASKRKI